MGKRNASELLHEEKRISSVLDRNVSKRPGLEEEAGRNVGSRYMRRDHVALEDEDMARASTPKAHNKLKQSEKVRLTHAAAASTLVEAQRAVDAERDEDDGAAPSRTSPVERLRRMRDEKRKEAGKGAERADGANEGPSAKGSHDPVEAAQQQNLLETQSFLDTQAVLEGQSQAASITSHSATRAAAKTASHGGRALRAGFATGGAAGKLARKAAFANQASARAGSISGHLPGAASASAPAAAQGGGATASGGGVAGAGAAIGIVAVAFIVVMLLIAMLAASQTQRRSVNPGDLAGMPGWVTTEFVEECLYIQEKYGLSAACAIAQAHKEVGGCWDGSSFTFNGQPYDMVNVANNYFCCTTGGSPGNVWAEEDNYQTYNGGVFISPFSASGYEWRMYEDAKQSIYDRARILLHESAYASVQAAVGKSTEEQVDALSNSPWCEGGYSAIMDIVNSFDLTRLDGMTVSEWQSSAGAGGEVITLSGGKLGNPLTGQSWIATSGFGWREFDNSFHKGFDMAASEGTPYYAAESGVVLYATNDGDYNGGAGNWVVIDHGDGLVTKYMHSSATFVTPGQTVERGQHIGNVGNTGASSGAHLHFQVEINGQAVDPLPLIGG